MIPLRDLGVSISAGAASARVSATIKTGFESFDEHLSKVFGDVIERWRKTIFNPKIKGSVANSTWIRRGKLLKTEAVPRTSGTGMVSEGHYRVVIGAKFPDDETAKYGITQEMGRLPGGAKKAKYYMVPLASWVMKSGLKSAGTESSGKNYVDSDKIRKDLSNSRTVWLKNEVKTKAGPARLVVLFNAGKMRRPRNKKGQFTKLTNLQVKSKLAREATAMYLAYQAATGVYGKSRMGFAKRIRKPMSPLAAQFGLTVRSVAPRWWSRAASGSLEILYRSINGIRYKGKAEAMGKKASAPSQVDEDGELIDVELAGDETSERVKEDILEEMRQLGMSDEDIRYWTAEE